MESIVWSVMSNLANAVTEGTSAENTREEIIGRYFSGPTNGAGNRYLFLSCPEFHRIYFTLLGEKHLKLLIVLLGLISTMVDYYHNSEAGLSEVIPQVDITKFRGIHKAFREIWAKCKDILKETPISLSGRYLNANEPRTNKPQAALG